MSRTADFDKEDIISKAMEVFWVKGFEGTTIKDLVSETGLLKGSLYNTFKSKENLFLLCLEKYGARSKTFFYKEGDPKIYLKKFFSRLVKEGCNKENVKGCLIMNSSMEMANIDSAPARKTKILFSATEKNFENVVDAIIAQSPAGTYSNKVNLKNSLLTAAFSIREISKFRKDKKFLINIANNALRDFDLKI